MSYLQVPVLQGWYYTLYISFNVLMYCLLHVQNVSPAFIYIFRVTQSQRTTQVFAPDPGINQNETQLHGQPQT